MRQAGRLGRRVGMAIGRCPTFGSCRDGTVPGTWLLTASPVGFPGSPILREPNCRCRGAHALPHDLLCHMTEGELAVVQNDRRFTARKGDVWACGKGISTEGSRNAGGTVAVMRIIDLLA